MFVEAFKPSLEGKPRAVFFLQTLYFTAFIASVEQIITYALGEHDPGSAQDWRTPHDLCSPVCCMYCFNGNGISGRTGDRKIFFLLMAPFNTFKQQYQFCFEVPCIW